MTIKIKFLLLFVICNTLLSAEQSLLVAGDRFFFLRNKCENTVMVSIQEKGVSVHIGVIEAGRAIVVVYAYDGVADVPVVSYDKGNGGGRERVSGVGIYVDIFSYGFTPPAIDNSKLGFRLDNENIRSIIEWKSSGDLEFSILKL